MGPGPLGPEKSALFFCSLLLAYPPPVFLLLVLPGVSMTLNKKVGYYPKQWGHGPISSLFFSFFPR